MDAAPARVKPTEAPRFVTGSTMRHVMVMTGSGSIGLIAIFVVDLLSLLYVSRLNDPRLTAGVGLATIVIFITMSINVGLMIAVGALVSRALGSRDLDRARRLATSCCIFMGLASVAVTLVLLPLLPWLLRVFGAGDETLPVAQSFLWIVLPSNVLVALGMGLSGVLRAVGDAKRGMSVTVISAVVTAVLDPLFIFGLGLGPNGAAIALVISRIVFVWVAFSGVSRVHHLLARPRWSDLRADAKPMFAIAFPAVLTNVATPLANGLAASVIARYGDQAIAANAIIDRLVPVAFGGLFALSASIGPILGQNWGAGRYDRMRETLRNAVVFVALYVGTIWVLLILARAPLSDLFNAEDLTARLVQFFCLISGPMWFFIGLLFVANAAFNNLGSPLFSTAFNWGRATLGIVPLAYAGAHYAGPEGALVGFALGSVAFGVGAIFTAFWSINRLERRAGMTVLASGDASARG
jgi:putative MATE family efflux protein